MSRTNINRPFPVIYVFGYVNNLPTTHVKIVAFMLLQNYLMLLTFFSTLLTLDDLAYLKSSKKLKKVGDDRVIEIEKTFIDKHVQKILTSVGFCPNYCKNNIYSLLDLNKRHDRVQGPWGSSTLQHRQDIQ